MLASHEAFPGSAVLRLLPRRLGDEKKQRGRGESKGYDPYSMGAVPHSIERQAKQKAYQWVPIFPMQLPVQGGGESIGERENQRLACECGVHRRIKARIVAHDNNE